MVAPQYREIKSQLTVQDPIWLELDEEASLVLTPSEFPAVAKVSDMADENWPQLIAADESVGSDTSGIRAVFQWADQWQLNAFSDDSLLRFLTFIHGAAFCVQDDNGQLSYVIQRNGKLLSVSRSEAYLQFSLYSQSFLESLYPEIFGPSLPAGGGWHEWNRFVRKQPLLPDERPEQNANNPSGVQRPLSPEGENNQGSTRTEAHAIDHSEQSSELHRENRLPSVQLDQDHALLYDRIRQKPIRLYGDNDKKGTIPVYKVHGEDTYYLKISKLFYESITQDGRIKAAEHSVNFIGKDPKKLPDFFIDFHFNAQLSSLSLKIHVLNGDIKKCRRMALPIIFNEKGERLLNKSFVLRGQSSCNECGCEVTENTITHPNPYPICLNSLFFGALYNNDRIRHNFNFPECIYVQIKLNPVE
ncbi:hypothetical protein [Endozoicomonas sp. 4G]|uniref:hypothetical protein n=1 Tax=Endozoicomonas sp. 4G TaxID=2872754 RepID=UPI0020786F7F|nr:hypothetical protein [Endozoicomonas sp. 4G]